MCPVARLHLRYNWDQAHCLGEFGKSFRHSRHPQASRLILRWVTLHKQAIVFSATILLQTTSTLATTTMISALLG
ncbi:hypothetical protein LshimejAT787_1002900 [Lyophyllum shimeji]|uniref:Uncharacterized protein n=1 Tax=Lyophyllum shimeji TaxID=47721 RepID=A0A9P3PTF6_LYOSH|nr:hypothetical protein LshimejAT787_1002900 [Lyophyllum shimeji]